MSRRMIITAGGQRFVAQAHPDAPKTFDAFARLLPYRQRLIHVRWSGEAVWVPLGDFELGVGVENATRYPAPGDVLFYPGGFSETELLIAYGPCSFASKMGPLAGNHFLRIVEGQDRLPLLGRQVLWEGAQEVLFDWETTLSLRAATSAPAAPLHRPPAARSADRAFAPNTCPHRASSACRDRCPDSPHPGR